MQNSGMQNSALNAGSSSDAGLHLPEAATLGKDTSVKG
jgi:hypothetical protein